MNKHVGPAVPLGALREFVKEHKALGERSVGLPFLLQWLDVDERLLDIYLRVGDAQSALERGDLTVAFNQLEFVKSRLHDFVTLP